MQKPKDLDLIPKNMIVGLNSGQKSTIKSSSHNYSTATLKAKKSKSPVKNR
jgi:hypothetical protein